MDFSAPLAGAGVMVGLLVGLTGMGGGALLTPLLVLVFGVPTLAAVSSDLVTSLVMKPVGAAVHLRHRTIDMRLLGWLCAGSVPAAFLGAVVIGLLSRGEHAAAVQNGLKVVIALALVASVASTLGRLWVERRAADTHAPTAPAGRGAHTAQASRTGHVGDTGAVADRSPGAPGDDACRLVVRPGRTALIGALGGFMVGLTSVGAGTLIIAGLLLVYPRLQPRQLVGTDIAQAIPLVASASLGHLLFGAVHFGVTGALLVGAIPGVIVGSLLSARVSSAVIRPVMSAVLLGSALALLGVPFPALLAAAAIAAGAVVVLSRPRRWQAQVA